MRKISQPKLLNAVFCNVYGTEFQAESMDDRVMLQKAVFLMREKGVSCGDYEFVWDQYGPFSAELSDDMKMAVEDASEEPVEFNQGAIVIMDRLKEAFAKESVYSRRYWVEAIASLWYLKQYMYPSYTDKEIIEKLETEKTFLGKHDENLKAMETVKEILAV